MRDNYYPDESESDVALYTRYAPTPSYLPPSTEDALETYLTLTAGLSYEHHGVFMFVFRYDPHTTWTASNPHSPWHTHEQPTWAMGRPFVGSPQ